MRENTVFEVSIEICQECAEIRDSGYIEEFYHEDFVFIILFYLFNIK